MPLWLPQLTAQLEEFHGDDQITLTAGATPHTKGAWTELLASAGADIHGVVLQVGGTGVNAGTGRCLLDIGVGPAGSERVVVPDWMCGAGRGIGPNSWGHIMFVPIYIAGGSRVATRIQREAASGTCQFQAAFLEQPMWPGSTAHVVAGYGVDPATSTGVVVTGGSAPNFGAWTQVVASTTEPGRWWWVSMDCGNDTSQNAATYRVQLGVGASGAEVVVGEWRWRMTGAEDCTGPLPPLPVYNPLPAGVRLAVRAITQNNGIGVAVYSAR